jgi:hypothetical protein
VLAASRYLLSASAYLPGAAAVGLEARIRAAIADRLPDSAPAVQVALSDIVTIEFTVSAATLAEARAEGRAAAEAVLVGASAIALDAVELPAPSSGPRLIAPV